VGIELKKSYFLVLLLPTAEPFGLDIDFSKAKAAKKPNQTHPKAYCLPGHISSRVANFHSKSDINLWASSGVTWSTLLLA
jgi:hypothetical protein